MAPSGDTSVGPALSFKYAVMLVKAKKTNKQKTAALFGNLMMTQ